MKLVFYYEVELHELPANGVDQYILKKRIERICLGGCQ